MIKVFNLKKQISFLVVLLLILSFITISFACKGEISDSGNEGSDSKTENPTETEPPKNNTAITANQFFWGTWVRMDNGKEYEVLESSVTQGGSSYKVTSSNQTSLVVKNFGTFQKQSDSVIVCNDIPYFRNGGINLEYSLKLVGFTSNGRDATRAAASAMRGVKGRGMSSRYTEFVSEGESDENGEIKLTAPTAHDVQTVTITKGDETIVIPGLTITNSGDFMGTVALVGKDVYNLKITGEIADEQKDNGYLYGNNVKSYKMTLSITNISDVKCTTSICSVDSDDKNLTISSATEDLSSFVISTLASGATKTVELEFSYGDISEPYVNTGINITIKNPKTAQEWKDYIPLRFFKGTIPLTVSAKNPENNQNAALNGFVIYPDGNNQFFAIPNGKTKTLFVPTFGYDKEYKLVFSGATVTSELSDSTEMFYTVAPGTLEPNPVVISGKEVENYILFGGENHSEYTAYKVTDSFESYLSEGEIDYYTIIADSTNFYSPKGSSFWSVTYENEKGEAPSSILIPDGGILTESQLPVLEAEDAVFGGWYVGNTKVTAGTYSVKETTVLTAKWLRKCSITYVTEHGTAPKSAIAGETEVITEKLLPNVDVDGWYLVGWYDGEKLVEAGKYIVTDDATFTAKWIEKYTVLYSSAHGTEPERFGLLKGETITKDNLPNLKEKGWKFLGWYLDSAYTEENKVTEGYEVNSNITLYAKWKQYDGPDDGFIDVEGGTFSMGGSVSNEQPIHRVTVSSFAICDHEVTQKEYKAVMGTNPSNFYSNPYNNDVQENRPVECVSWFDIIYFCNKYSISVNLKPCYSVDGKTDVLDWGYTPHKGNSISGTITCDWVANGYRLPTEAEWEYAARGGKESKGYTYSGSDTCSKVAWNIGGWYLSENEKTREVKKFEANELGLYDMSGNVWEYCWDLYDSYSNSETIDPRGASSGSYRTIRGGSFDKDYYYCTVSRRTSISPSTSSSYNGFRLVRSDP